jgi:hypothetical protein
LKLLSEGRLHKFLHAGNCRDHDVRKIGFS